MGRARFEASEVRLEVLEEAFPVRKIEVLLDELNRRSVRVRKLPATMMVYYVIALGLFVSVGCREVLRRLLEDLMRPAASPWMKTAARSGQPPYLETKLWVVVSKVVYYLSR